MIAYLELNNKQKFQNNHWNNQQNLVDLILSPEVQGLTDPSASKVKIKDLIGPD